MNDDPWTDRLRFLMLAGILILQTVFMVQISQVAERQMNIMSAQAEERQRELAEELRIRDKQERQRMAAVKIALIDSVRNLDLEKQREKKLIERIRRALASRIIITVPEPGNGPGSTPSASVSPNPKPKSPPSCEPAGNSDQCKPPNSGPK